MNLASTLARVPTDQVQVTTEAEPTQTQIARIEPLTKKDELSTADSSSSSSSEDEDTEEEEVADLSAEIHLTGRGLFF